MARRSFCVVAALVLGALLVGASANTGPQRGVFALAHGTPALRAYVTVHPTATGLNELDIVQYQGASTTPVMRYAVDQTKLMHLILVRDDFRTFQHVHPVLSTNGHFSVAVALDSGHRFYAYADTAPAGDTQQVYRFVLQAGDPPHKLDTTVAASKPSTLAGPYRVDVSATRIPANRPYKMTTAVWRNGRIASDLHPYLGAAAHAVFINTSTLDYVHVHPTVGNAPMRMGPGDTMPVLPASETLRGRMTLWVPPMKAGTYKAWVQFRGGSSLYVAPFTIVAR